MSEIVIYMAGDGHIQLEVNLSNETIWLSQQQIADLFGTKRPAITKHLKNIFTSEELHESSVCSILEHTADDGKIYKTKFYSLDAILSVGYRVNSSKATQFRIWATNLLKNHLINGYTLYERRLKETGVKVLHQSIELLNKTLVNHQMISDLGSEVVQVIISYAKTWSLLLAYDEDRLELPQKGRGTIELPYEAVVQAISSLMNDLSSRQEATAFFGRERDRGLQNILMNIDQTFDDKPLYKSAEEKASHLLYFIIKDHPFVDGNKRIGCFIFLIYLKLQNICFKLNDNGLVALALLIAESDPPQKDIMIRLVTNILIN